MRALMGVRRSKHAIQWVMPKTFPRMGGGMA